MRVLIASLLLVAAAGCSPAPVAAPPPLPGPKPAAELPDVAPAAPELAGRFYLKGDTPGVTTFADFSKRYTLATLDGDDMGHGVYAVTVPDGFTVATLPVTSMECSFRKGVLMHLTVKVRADDDRLFKDTLNDKYGPAEGVGSGYARWESSLEDMRLEGLGSSTQTLTITDKTLVAADKTAGEQNAINRRGTAKQDL
ncbi:hypothetical protein [Planctomyces sp. SH-PL14]|uniref:hypothetical protein n=1 Tax=Planctomyces sp. SH-PL14 TaxID=1632864 RepID=UPI00078E6462|nr:hypothetical protein [Planctomyces sp. SH-PL14]AMV16611.1 hypothetical protein VT03_01895 [Planctomyces sp. SH-PL14]